MGCISSKVLTKSGDFQETVGQSFQRRSNVIEEIILSSSKSNGDQFLALLCASDSSATRKADQSPAAAAAEPPARIETIHVSELLAGLEEESYDGAAGQEQERRSDRRVGGEERSPAQCCASDGGAAGRGRSFRTVEEFDALVTQSGSSGRATPSAPEQEELAGTAVATTSGLGASTGTAAAAESSSSGQEESAESTGLKRRARARQLGDLKVAPAFDFSKSGSLRDWLVRGGQTFSPGSYVTPRFGTAPAEHEGGHKAGDQQHAAVFDPELVAQFERAMEQLSEDEERVLTEILDALDLEAGEKEVASGRLRDQPAAGGGVGMMVN